GDGMLQHGADCKEVRAGRRLTAHLLGGRIAGDASRWAVLDPPIWMEEQCWRESDEHDRPARAQKDVGWADIAMEHRRLLAVVDRQHVEDLERVPDGNGFIQRAVGALNAVEQGLARWQLEHQEVVAPLLEMVDQLGNSSDLREVLQALGEK